MSGILISFDGLDSSGKATQVRRLCDRLTAFKRKFLKIETPDYTTPSGKELKRRLQGKLGDWQNTSWKEKLGYFASNRAEHRAEVVAALQAGNIVVYDRYVPSSLVFMAVEAGDSEPAEAVHAEVERVEYGTNGMPHEDISLFLDVPPEVANRLLSGRKQTLQDEDEYTDALDVQARMYAAYATLAASGRITRIDCMDGDRLLTPDEIGELVWQAIMPKLSS